MTSSQQVSRILSEMSGQNAIMAIYNLLTPIFYSEPEKLSAEERVIVYIEELEGEVSNGGFSQFFFNTSGDYTEEVIQSLQKIGSIKFLRLAESAKAQFPSSIVPADKTERRQILEEIDEDANDKWNDLDNEFYQYEEDIYSLMSSYIKRNIEKFR